MTNLVFQLNILMPFIKRTPLFARTIDTMNFVKEFHLCYVAFLCDLGPRMAQERNHSRTALTPYLFCFLHVFPFQALTAKLSLITALGKGASEGL